MPDPNRSKQPTACVQLLMGVLCYEVSSGRLSGEMQGLLEIHLQSCDQCAVAARNFVHLVFREAALPVRAVPSE